MNFLDCWQAHKTKHVGKEISDKGTTHDYINAYYSNLFTDRDAKIKLVEIGIGTGLGLVFWTEWFTNAEIVAIEKYPYHYFHQVPFETPGATSIFKDAYTLETVNYFSDSSIDFLIDDGPHTLESQLYCLENYISKIKPGGKIIIEDIQSIDHEQNFKTLIAEKNINVEFKVFDFRKNKDRYDDIIFEFTKLS